MLEPQITISDGTFDREDSLVVSMILSKMVLEDVFAVDSYTIILDSTIDGVALRV